MRRGNPTWSRNLTESVTPSPRHDPTWAFAHDLSWDFAEGLAQRLAQRLPQRLPQRLDGREVDRIRDILLPGPVDGGGPAIG